MQLTDQDELEDFLIEAMGSEVVKGTIDQRNKAVLVASCIPRHVSKGDIAKLVAKLGDWKAISTDLIAQLTRKVEQLKQEEVVKTERAKEFQRRVKAVLAAQ